MIPDEIKAVKGDKILPKFKKLVAWIDSQRLISVDDRVTTNTTPNGTLVSMVEGPPHVLTPLKVVQNGNLINVTEGYINGQLPNIGATNGVPDPIVNEQGEPVFGQQMPKKKPFIVYAVAEFDEKFIFKLSFIKNKPADEFNFVNLNAGYNPERKTIQADIPLAFMRSDRFIQFVSHNLQVRAYKHNGQYRAVYWPA